MRSLRPNQYEQGCPVYRTIEQGTKMNMHQNQKDVWIKQTINKTDFIYFKNLFYYV